MKTAKDIRKYKIVIGTEDINDNIWYDEFEITIDREEEDLPENWHLYKRTGEHIWLDEWYINHSILQNYTSLLLPRSYSAKAVHLNQWEKSYSAKPKDVQHIKNVWLESKLMLIESGRILVEETIEENWKKLPQIKRKELLDLVGESSLAYEKSEWEELPIIIRIKIYKITLGGSLKKFETISYPT